jgi:hypothetical protein
MLGWTKEQVVARFKEIEVGEGSYYNKSTKKKNLKLHEIKGLPFS